MKAVNLNIYGVKCDNPNCDYRDMTVPISDYKKYLNKPCPKCGANLLTKADYKAMKRLMRIAKFFNFVFRHKYCNPAEMVTGHIEMNGTGKMKINL